MGFSFLFFFAMTRRFWKAAGGMEMEIKKKKVGGESRRGEREMGKTVIQLLHTPYLAAKTPSFLAPGVCLVEIEIPFRLHHYHPEMFSQRRDVSSEFVTHKPNHSDLGA